MSKNSRAYDLRYYHDNKGVIREKRKASRAAWTEDQREAARVRQRAFNASHPGYSGLTKDHRENKRKEREYGLTPNAWDMLFAGQGFRCAVCRTDDPGSKRKGWCTDHDHATGQVRGILCHHCNVALGHTRDDPERLRALASYIERSRSGDWRMLISDAMNPNVVEKKHG